MPQASRNLDVKIGPFLEDKCSVRRGGGVEPLKRAFERTGGEERRRHGVEQLSADRLKVGDSRAAAMAALEMHSNNERRSGRQSTRRIA